MGFVDMTLGAVSGVARSSLRIHGWEPNLRKVVDTPVPADHRVALAEFLEVLPRMYAVNQKVEIDSLRRLGFFGWIRRIRPLRSICIGWIVTEDAHLDVIAIAAMQC